jgi:hypothetical protein
MEDDFPFSFGGGSDQDDNNTEDDGLFCAPKDKKKAAAKAKALLCQEPYHAQIDEDGVSQLICILSIFFSSSYAPQYTIEA